MTIRRDDIHVRIRLIAMSLLAGSLPFPILLSNVAIWLLIVNWLLEGAIKDKLKGTVSRGAMLFFVLFYVWYWVGLLYTSNMKSGFFELEKKLTFLAFPLLFSLTRTPVKLKEIRVVAWSFILSTVFATFICLVNAVYLNYQEGHDLTYVCNAVFRDIHLPGHYYYFNYWYFTNKLFASAVGIHPVYLAMYLVFSSCLAAWLWYTSTTRRTGGLFILLFYNLVMIVLLASRTQLLIFFVLVLGFVLAYMYSRKRMMTGFAILTGSFALVLSIIWFNPILKERFIDSNKPGGHFSNNKFGEGGLSLRLYKWKYTTKVIASAPLLGVGTGDAQDELQKEYLKENFLIGYENNFNAHNQFLQSTLELGLVGLFIFLGYLFVSIQHGIKSKMWIHVIFVGVFVVSCSTESMLEANKGIVFFSFFNCLFTFADSSGAMSDSPGK